MSCRKAYLVVEAANFLPSVREQTQLPLAELLAGQIWRPQAGRRHRTSQTPLESILLPFFPSFAEGQRKGNTVLEAKCTDSSRNTRLRDLMDIATLASVLEEPMQTW